MAIKATEAASHVADDLLRDAAEAQRSRGAIPRPEDNAALVLPILERMDRNHAEAKPRPAPGPTAERPNAVQREYERRCREQGRDPDFAGIEMRRDVEASAERMAQGPTITGPAQNMVGMRARLRLLAMSPEWGQRARDVSRLLIQAQLSQAMMGPAQAKPAWGLAHGALKQLLADSASAHGPWWEPEKKIIVNG